MPGLEMHTSENNIANRRGRIVQKKEFRKLIKSTCNLTLEDKDGRFTKFLGLLDTGSNSSLIAEELAEKYKIKRVSDKGTWNTNNRNFKTTSKAIVESLCSNH